MDSGKCGNGSDRNVNVTPIWKKDGLWSIQKQDIEVQTVSGLIQLMYASTDVTFVLKCR